MSETQQEQQKNEVTLIQENSESEWNFSPQMYEQLNQKNWLNREHNEKNLEELSSENYQPVEARSLNWQSLSENPNLSLNPFQNEEERLKKVNIILAGRKEIQEIWWADEYIIDWIIDVIDNAEMVVNIKTWNTIPDKKAKLAALKFLADYSWRGRKVNVININVPFTKMPLNKLLNK